VTQLTPAQIAASAISATAIARQYQDALSAGERGAEPYPHFKFKNVLPGVVIDALMDLPISPLDLHGVSGRREIHNDQRHYFDARNMATYPFMRAMAEAFQMPQMVSFLQQKTGASLEGTFVRLEYCQDVEGFWLEPHTDIGVKRFTNTLCLGGGANEAELGTDIYWDKERYFGRAPFGRGTSFLFVPSNNTWHGFEPRKIDGVRKTVIMNYVTKEWRERGQLSFPDEPVSAA